MPEPNNKRYSLDANVLIYAWHEVYSPDFLPPFWERLDALIREGRAVLSEEVYEELRRKSDDLFAWIKQRPQAIVPHTDAVQAAASRILSTHPLLVKARKNRSGADPFVIAVAMCEHCTVVTQEGPGSDNAPKIPDVCRAYRVPYQSLRDLIRDEGWRFS
jgi:hypothetical protein